MTVVTPTVGARLRSARFWLALGGVAVAGAVAVAVIGSGGGTGGRPLGPANAAPAGAKAVVEVLRDEGIDVSVTTTLDATSTAVSGDPERTSLLVDDVDGFLTDDQWDDLGRLDADVVLLSPGQSALDVLAPGVTAVGPSAGGVAAPRCDVASLARLDRVDVTGSAYAIDGSDAEGCLPTDSGLGFVEYAGTTSSVTVVGATRALTNGSIADEDNAAFALSVLGRSPSLVWYLPSPADVPEGGGTLATLTPSWVTPSLVLLFLAGVAAMVWRGRRLGPLVVERLPVTVRASETTEGRARLYERSGQRLHALDQLRIGTLSRLSRATGLASGASVDEVVSRVSALLAADPAGVRSVLVDAHPADDRDLVALSDALLDLERAVHRATTPP